MSSERELGPQPLAEVMERHGLRAHDLVAASLDQITHKMVARGVKGRRLTANTMGKLVAALNRAAGATYARTELFNYSP